MSIEIFYRLVTRAERLRRLPRPYIPLFTKQTVQVDLKWNHILDSNYTHTLTKSHLLKSSSSIVEDTAPETSNPGPRISLISYPARLTTINSLPDPWHHRQFPSRRYSPSSLYR